ncbi:Casparian strip membrane protein domain - like 3 [Theobroma cacao]|nr:Casparian strip membrane protein domain - like 3 [Theobroma cacao]
MACFVKLPFMSFILTVSGLSAYFIHSMNSLLLLKVFAVKISDKSPFLLLYIFVGFSYLIASMGLQVLWSFGLACLDLHALRSKRNLQNPILVSLFVVGDWVTAILSLAAACSSAGVTVLYSRDLGYCTSPHIPCSRFQASIFLAFISWFLLAISSHVTFWLLAAV